MDAAKLFWRSSKTVHYLYPEREMDIPTAFGFVPFEEQRAELGDLFHQLRGDRVGWQSSLVRALLEAWEEELRACGTALDRLWARRELDRQPHYILMDYLHMLGNRLGLSLPEECYLYSVIARAIEEGLPSSAAERRESVKG